MDQKAEFYWAVIGDASPEPVAVTAENGKRVAYTIGCADPFDLDSPESPVELLRPQDLEAIWNEKDHTQYYVAQGYTIAEPEPMEIPDKVLLPELVARREAAEARLVADKQKRHGWRRWNP